jgi:secreted PhoX family phosphatase
MHMLSKLGLASALLAFAPSAAQAQDLFVSNANANSISRFAGTGPGTFDTTPTTLSGGLSSPQGLAFDARGDLFVANPGDNTITEFAAGPTPGTLGIATTFASGLHYSAGLAFDKTGDLFASNYSSNSITEFAAGPMLGTFGPATTFATGGDLKGPAGLVFDKSGDLFVNNQNGGSGSGSVTEFASDPATGTLGTGTTFTDPSLNLPGFLGFDNNGDLFVANQVGNSITKFASTGQGTFGPGTTFVSGLNFPDGLAFDTNGDLFAASFGDGTLMEFASTGAGTFTPGKIVESGLSGPIGLAFGPSVPPAVPEASSVVSLGVLLALGLGGLAVSARRRKPAAL